MPFQIRHGTEAERLTITPELGEPIFTTDTKRLYVGDDTTVGGVRVSGEIPDNLDDLNDVSIPTVPSSGDVLTWNGSSFVAQQIPPSFFEGSNYRINIVADDSTVLVDTSTQQFNGDLTGNVTGTVTGDVVGNVTGNITGEVYADILKIQGDVVNVDSTLIYDTVTNTFYSNIQGNVTGDVTGNLEGEVVANSLQIRGDIVNDNSTVIFNQEENVLLADVTGDVSGNVTGNVTGNLTGNVTGDVTGNLTGNVTGDVTGNLEGEVVANSLQIRGDIVNDNSTVIFNQEENVLLADVTGDVTGNVTGNITGNVTGNVTGDVTGNLEGEVVANSLQIRGDIVNDDSSVIYIPAENTFYANLQGNVDGDLTGSVFLDDSTPIVDGINGTITANGFIQFGSYTSSDRPSGANGMVIYNTTVNRFQGFQNGGWINLDDGSGA